MFIKEKCQMFIPFSFMLQVSPCYIKDVEVVDMADLSHCNDLTQ